MVPVRVETAYPWEGTVTIEFSPESPETFTCALRIPGWCAHYTALVNGIPAGEKPEKGYLRLNRQWKKGDQIVLTLDMPVRLVMANPAVRENVGKAAVCRGPLVYCLEEKDNGPRLDLLSLEEVPRFEVHYEQDLLGGVPVITGEGRAVSCPWPGEALYGEAVKLEYQPRRLTWIPYHRWANRGPGEMLVWIRRS
jgi:DUF1680 family protein